MSELILEQLFDSQVKIRLLKLFLRNDEKIFSAADISRQIKVKNFVLNKPLKKMTEIGFLNKKSVRKSQLSVVKKNKKNTSAKEDVYFLNKKFGLYLELKNLILKSSPASRKKMLERIKRLGNVKLVLLAGIFINSDNSRADIIIVGDKISQGKVNNFINDLEAEIGKEINYAVMSVKEFYYRYGMYDRFVRDAIEYPHDKLINKLKI